jgi:hypothetical protein
MAKKKRKRRSTAKSRAAARRNLMRARLVALARGRASGWRQAKLNLAKARAIAHARGRATNWAAAKLNLIKARAAANKSPKMRAARLRNLEKARAALARKRIGRISKSRSGSGSGDGTRSRSFSTLTVYQQRISFNRGRVRLRAGFSDRVMVQNIHVLVDAGISHRRARQIAVRSARSSGGRRRRR